MDQNGQPTAKAQKSSLPIARTNATGYDRPERARTSHACEPCRERKTKCDGERPACRRCTHTGTGCHYGYGKGWRKRKTAEDLNATSKKLQRYEMLLADIIPLVNPEVRRMIDDVRQQEAVTSSNMDLDDHSTSTPTQTPSLPSMSDHERSTSTNSGRMPLTLPMPTPSNGQPTHGPPSFDRVSSSTSPHLAHHPKRELPFDEPISNRLPSITHTGLLIEGGGRDLSPGYATVSGSCGPAAPRPDLFSPRSATITQETSSRTAISNPIQPPG